MKVKFISKAEAIRRMKNGDLPTQGGGYSAALYFSDGQRTTSRTGSQLVMLGIVERPGPWNGQSATSCDSTYRLVVKP